MPAPRIANCLDDREFLRDLAQLAEGLASFDIAEGSELGSLAAQELHHRSKGCARLNGQRERPHHGIACPVRYTCSRWASKLKSRYDARVVAFIDGEGMRAKAVTLFELTLPGAKLLVVVFRSSCTTSDWMSADGSVSFQRLAPVREAVGTCQKYGSSVNLLPLDAYGRPRLMVCDRKANAPCCASGVWAAYTSTATQKGDEPKALRTVRECVLTAVESWLSAGDDGTARHVLLTGASIGGTLANLCAVDLLHASAPLRDSIEAESFPLLLVTFGSSRSFNQAFRQATAGLVNTGLLVPLRVVTAGELVPCFPFDLVPFGCVHAIAPRLLLRPGADETRAATFKTNAHAADADLRLSAPMRPSCNNSVTGTRGHTTLLVPPCPIPWLPPCPIPPCPVIWLPLASRLSLPSSARLQIVRATALSLLARCPANQLARRWTSRQCGRQCCG